MVVRIGGKIMWKTFFRCLLVTAILFGVLQLVKLVYPLDMWSVLFGVIFMVLGESIHTVLR